MGSGGQLKNSIFAIYEGGDKAFRYSSLMKETFSAEFDNKPLWQALTESRALTEQDGRRMKEILDNIESSEEPVVQQTEFSIRNAFGRVCLYNVIFVYNGVQEEVVITFTEIKELWKDHGLEQETDALTGLLTRNSFLERVEESLRNDAGSCMMVYFDVQRFKVINNMQGREQGDRLLHHIADQIRMLAGKKGYGGHLGADCFVFVIYGTREKTEQCIDKLFDEITKFGNHLEILCNAGIYEMNDSGIEAGTAIDCAIIAQREIKGSYTEHFRYYNAELSKHLIGEQEIVGMMRNALEEEQFVIYYQPQYNHVTGMLVGAEALVRWLHPEKGLIPPVQFIPVFEKNGFITELAQYVFEKVCIFVRKCMDQKLTVVPVSVNMTRYDIFKPGFIEHLEEVRKKYQIPPKYIRIELTESSALGSSLHLNEAIKKIHSYGFTVEMDDFGSGYSSLNILKDIDFDVIKLDMAFIQKGRVENKRGGTILSSVVRMVNWLQLPLIAEGVETMEQADFLRSIGCDYIQGYLYSRPIPERDYRQLLGTSYVGDTASSMNVIEPIDMDNLWSSDSLETLIFSNYAGAVAIFDYEDGKAEFLRINRKYLQELGMNLTERDLVNRNFLESLESAEREIYIKKLEKAIETQEEQECETWHKVFSSSCGEERLCIRSTIRLLGKNKENYIFYATIKNITAEKKRYLELLEEEHRFEEISEQMNIYYWEYMVATKEMHPCFRCMRDFGLPSLVQNYPDSAIENGFFPPEAADMYRDWHRQIAEGVPYLEGIIPFTVGRIPFHVRYTTKFDENGRPVKAYGSATLVERV